MKASMIALSLFAATSTLVQASELGKDYRLADDELNRTYKTLIANIEETSGPFAKAYIQLLRESQRAWIKFRDTNCEFKAYAGEFSPDKYRLLTCQTEMTETRTQELREKFAD